MLKTFRISFSSTVDIQAENEEEAKKIFFNMSDEEIGATIEEYESIESVGNVEDTEDQSDITHNKK